jgi:hypothetical protein
MKKVEHLPAGRRRSQGGQGFTEGRIPGARARLDGGKKGLEA